MDNLQMHKGDRVVRVIKRDPMREEYIRRHKVSLLHLYVEMIIEEYPEEIPKVLEKLRLQKQAA